MKLLTYSAFALSFFLSMKSLSAQSLVGEWMPITGNEYRDTIVKTEKEFDCFRGTRLHFDAKGTHIIERKNHVCEIKGIMRSLNSYLDTYNYYVEKQGDSLLLRYYLVEGSGAPGTWINYVYFVNESVFFVVGHPEWRDVEERRWFYRRVK